MSERWAGRRAFRPIEVEPDGETMRYRPLGVLLCLSFLASAGAQEGSGFTVFNGRVYSGQGRQLTTRSVANGQILWDIRVPAPGNSLDTGVIQVDGEVVACGGGSAERIFALNASNGKLMWDRDGYCRAMTSDGSKLFVLHRPDGSISSLDARSGRTLWENDGNGPATTILVLKNRVISDNIEVDEDSGKTILKGSLSSVLLGSGNGALFWEGRSGDLICSTPSEHELWRLPMPLRRIVQFESDASGEYVAVYDDYSFVANHGILMKVDTTGHDLWRTSISTGLPLPASPFSQVDEGLMVLLPTDSRHSVVRAFSRTTGAEVWRSQPLEDAVGPVVDASGKILFETRDGQLEVLSRNSGSAVPF